MLSPQLGGIQPHIIPTQPDGTFDVNEIPVRIRMEDVHYPRTALVCIENTQNVCGGKVLPRQWIDQVYYVFPICLKRIDRMTL